MLARLKSLPDLRRHAPAFAILSLYAYLGFHVLSGSQGAVRWMEHERRATVLEARLEELKTHREALQGEVDRLSPNALDLDTLDIAARRRLHVAAQGEITIWLDPKDRAVNYR